MSSTFTIRPVQPDDSPALAALIQATPSLGQISFTYKYLADVIAVHQALSPGFDGLVALEGETIVGLVFGERLDVQYAGGVRPAGYISNLRVHPDYRRQGIAHSLAAYGLPYAKNILGQDGLLYAAVPAGNLSEALLSTYNFHTTQPIQGGAVPMRGTPPRDLPGISVRPAFPSDLPSLADGMNRFYKDHILWSPVSPSSLAPFLEQQAAEVRPNQLYLAERAGQIVAGLSTSDRTNLVRMRIAHAPVYLHLLGALLGVLPATGSLRSLTVRHVWYAPGEQEAAQHLWQSLRYRLRHQATSLGIAFDPQDYLADVFQLPSWLPLVSARYGLRTTLQDDPDRPVYCLAGP